MGQDRGEQVVCIFVTCSLVTVIAVGTITAQSVSDLTVGLKYQDCLMMCDRRVNCNSVRYLKRYPVCILHKGDDSIPSREPGFTRRLKKSPTMVASCSACKDPDFCDISSTNEVICTPTQCQVPVDIPGAELKGNMLAVGSKARYKCIGTSKVNTIKCLPGGSWSETNLLSCNCKVQDGDYHATTGFEMVNESYIALTLDCHSGYELLEMDKPICNLLTGEWFGLKLSGCYRMRVLPWRKIYSYTPKRRGNILQEFLQTKKVFFINNLQPNGQFRDSNIFDNWAELVLKRIRFNVVVNWEVVKYMLFNGTNSTILTWFSSSRLLESSWTDLDSNTDTYLFNVNGLNKPWSSRFIISKYLDKTRNCGDDSGWFTICWSYYPCDTSVPGIVILYAKGTTSSRFVSNEIGLADRVEIWIEE